jgi:histidyl-tRNA synthetase
MSKKDKLSTEPYKGVRDFYPEDQAFLNYFIATCKGMVEKAGYVEYHASVLEPAELYRAKGAENEELAGEQTYTFEDRGGRMVTLRPEMTPTVPRAGGSWASPCGSTRYPMSFATSGPSAAA